MTYSTRARAILAGSALSGAGVVLALGLRHRRFLLDSEEAYVALRDRMAEVDPQWLDASPTQGCCGCGSFLADVDTGTETYCWRCVDKRPHLIPDEYRVLHGRER